MKLTAASIQPPTTSHHGTTAVPPQTAANAKSSAITSQSVAAPQKLSPKKTQYLKAIAMSSPDLGAILTKPTERIAKKLGQAIAHEEKAKAFRREAKHEFDQNIAFYYEAKQRLLNPGYRTDVDGGKDRTPSDNEKWFGAPNWVAFNQKCAAYSLQHADRKLKEFAKEQGLLTDGGENIDDLEPEDGDGAKPPEPRRTPDQTAQRRYEHIATAAMAIANKNPEGEIEKQILAAAEHIPAAQMPLPPDIYTETLTFVTKIASSITDQNVRAEAKQLRGKLLLHRPIPDPTKVLAEATEEEKRKRAKRLAKKNGEALGSATYNPPTNGTSEHVQRSMGGAQPEAGRIAAHEGQDREHEGMRAAAITTALTHPMEAEPQTQRASQKTSMDALETTRVVGGKSSSEIKQLIANPKSHSYDLVALKVALSARLAFEAAQ